MRNVSVTDTNGFGGPTAADHCLQLRCSKVTHIVVTTSPPQLAQRHLDTVLANLPGVFDGDSDSVHQARIATRRLREVLPLLTEAEHVTNTVRSAGQQLGHVRELDVMSRLLESLSDRVPVSAATELHTLRHSVRK